MVESRAERANTKPLNVLRGVAGSSILLVSLVFIYQSLHLFTFRAEVLGKYFAFKWMLMGHVAGGMAALLTGPFQLWKGSRARYRSAHRIAGRVYVGAVTLGAGCALVLASTTAPKINWPYAVSLHALAVVWLVSTLLAWRTAVGKRMKEHEEWATRSYIATVAFVAQSVAFTIPFVARLGTIAELGGTVIWLSWTVPMFAYACVRTRARRPSTS